MDRALVILILLSVSASLAADDDTPFSFKGVPLGSTEVQLKAVFPEFNCKEENTVIADRLCVADSRSPCYKEEPSCVLDEAKPWNYGGVTAMVIVSFYADVLSHVQILFDSQHFASVASVMIAKFGQPDENTKKMVQNNAGATFEDIQLWWNKPSSLLTAKKYAGKITRSKVEMHLNSASTEFEKRREEHNKKAAKKL